MNSELAKVESPTTKSALVLKESLAQATEQKALLVQYVEKHMVKGTDYGEIPGTKNPTLLKPGAEKLVDLFRCTPKFKLIEKQEDFDKGFFNYMFRVQLYSRDADAVLAEGYGSANSREGRYRWRTANRKCPHCGKESIIAGKAEYGGGWLCFKKKGGCGAKFDQMAEEITKQAQGLVENDDIATLANTILKMAKKRSLVDGAIALARCSDLFTQDVEDLDHPADAEPVGQEKAPPKAGPKATPAVVGSSCEQLGHEWDLKGVCQVCGVKEGGGKPPPKKEEKPAVAQTQTKTEPTKAQTPKQPAHLRARAIKVWQEAQKAGMDLNKFQAWTEKVLERKSESASWTEDEIAHLEDGLLEVKAFADEPGANG